MQEPSTQRIYDLHSNFYDATFGRIVRRRIKRAITHLPVAAGDHVLDLGVGTGQSLRFYPNDVRVVGVDLSAGMLRQAGEKLDADGVKHIALVQGNALDLPFADSTFDHVFLSHVISVVSDPAAVLRETRRVTKPGGRLVVLNHFQSSNKFIAFIERMLCPLCVKLGWRSDLALHDLLGRDGGVRVEYRYKLTSPDLWETVVLTNTKAA